MVVVVIVLVALCDVAGIWVARQVGLVPFEVENPRPGTATYAGVTVYATCVLHAGPAVVLSVGVATPGYEKGSIVTDPLVSASGKVLHNPVDGPMFPGPAHFYTFYTPDGTAATDTSYTLRVTSVSTGRGRSGGSLGGHWTLHIVIPTESRSTQPVPPPSPIDTESAHITFARFRHSSRFLTGTMEATGLFVTRSPRDVPTVADQEITMTLRYPSGEDVRGLDYSYPVGARGDGDRVLKRGRDTAVWPFAGPGTYSIRVFVGRYSRSSVERPFEVS